MHQFQIGRTTATLNQSQLSIIFALYNSPMPLKIEAIKYLREEKDLGLAEAKWLCDFIGDHARQETGGTVFIECEPPRVTYLGKAQPAVTTLGELLRHNLENGVSEAHTAQDRHTDDDGFRWHKGNY